MLHKSRLVKLGIDSLEMRRLRQDLIFAYKLIFGLVGQSADEFFVFTNSVHSQNTRGHAFKLFPASLRVDSYKYFIANRVIAPWNSLPAEPEHFRSLLVFKNFINAVDLTEFVSIGF